MFSKYWHNELIPSRSCHGLRGKCTGHGEKYGDHWKERKTWHFNYTPLIREKLYRNGREHGKLSPADFSIKLQRLAENCIFFELSERRMHFAPECSETELHITQSLLTPIWWLPLFQVSGEKTKSDTEFHLQESPRYNIPLSGTTRLDSLSSSVANGELRWSRCPGLRWMIGPGQQKQKVKTPEAKNPAWPEPQGSHKKMLQKTMVITIKDS